MEVLLIQLFIIIAFDAIFASLLARPYWWRLRKEHKDD